MKDEGAGEKKTQLYCSIKTRDKMLHRQRNNKRPDQGLRSGPEVIKLFSCSTQLSMKYIMLINVKMPSIVGILTFMSRIND